jgi:arsenite-transporting ATPase
LRVVLFAGQGGVGRTTAAAATAVLAARSAKVLLVSSGVLGVPAGPDPVPVGELRVLHVDVRASFEARWPGSAAELALPPGAAELLRLLEARDRALAGNWDAVLLDGPPLDALLSLGSLAGTVERLWPEHTRSCTARRSPTWWARCRQRWPWPATCSRQPRCGWWSTPRRPVSTPAAPRSPHWPCTGTRSTR